MKTLAVIIIIVGVLIGVTQLRSTSTVTVETEVITETVVVDPLGEAIEQAQKERKAEVESAAQSAYDDMFNQKMKEIELEVIKEYNAELDRRQEELEKETHVYWQDKSNVVSLIRATFPEDSIRALAIARCESGYDPDALNVSNPDGSRDSGLFQINSTHNSRVEELGLDVFDPEDNVTFARMLYDESGWDPWVCHTRQLAYL